MYDVWRSRIKNIKLKQIRCFKRYSVIEDPYIKIDGSLSVKLTSIFIYKQRIVDISIYLRILRVERKNRKIFVRSVLRTRADCIDVNFVVLY